MSEYLDRKQVIDLYEKYHPRLATFVWEFGQELRKLPIVERPRGEWICKGSVGNGTWCTVCDTNIKLFPNRYSFCPNCGALMYAVPKIKKAVKRND